jgi:ABC-type Co2+ transport system permease subunit
MGGAAVELGRVCFRCPVGLSVIDAIVTLLVVQYLREVVPDLSGSLNSPRGL